MSVHNASTPTLLEQPTRFLGDSFYSLHTLDVAPRLIGKILAVGLEGEVVAGRIVETEAYCGPGDEASHAGRGMTARNSVMFGPAGHAYVYFSYGMHHLFNVVTEGEGVPGAVLVRALEPIEGIGAMQSARRTSKLSDLCSGPAKLTQALGIDLSFNAVRLSGAKGIAVLDDGFAGGDVVAGPRIGITKATDLPWRFYVKENPYVSRR